MIRSIDHIVILVENLAAAIEDYRALGFSVTPGGEHADGATHNALVPFSDGSYLELIAFKGPSPAHRWWGYRASGGGLIDFALLPDDTAAHIAEARSRGVAIEGPIAGGRLRPDGERVQWQIGRPAYGGMPFLCGDITPRSLRVPDGAAQQHANGVIGVNGVTVAVDDLDLAATRYAALLGVATPPSANITPLGLHIAVFELDRDAIALVQPSNRESVLQQQLSSRGPGIYAIALLTSMPPPDDWPDPQLAHGVRMELHYN